MTITTRPNRYNRILIIDDVPENLKLLSRMLKNAGYHVRSARSGQMALRSIEIEEPDLIMLDIRMPELNGYEVCLRLKEHADWAKIPVIFISALNETEDIVKAFDVGGADYVTKPFRPREVLARVQTQLTLVRQQHELQQEFDTLTLLRDQMLREVTHDLQTPLAIIRGFADLLNESVTAGKLNQIPVLVKGLNDGVDRISNIMGDMLDLARLETGVAYQFEAVSVNDLLENSQVAYREIARQADVSLTLRAVESMFVYADPHQLQRMLDNLVSNAIKYTPAGGQVQIEAVDQDPDVELIIRDTGLGIPANDLPHIFTPLFRVRDGREAQIPGTGLGLAIVKTIVDQHGGTIEVVSAPDEGSCFTIRLPQQAGINGDSTTTDSD